MKEKSTLKDVANNYLTHTKKEKGITLVALVVTIVVLLILAGVSISLVLDQNGIINKAKGARTEYQNAANYEKDLLTDTNTAWIDNLTKD